VPLPKVSLWLGSLENFSLMQLESEKIAATIPKITIFFLKDFIFIIRAKNKD